MKQRKDGRWVKTVKLGGKRLFFYSSEKTEKKALKDIERQMVEYREDAERGKPFKAVAEEWEVKHYPSIAYSTARRYEIYLKQINACFADAYIKNITAKDVLEFLNKLVKAGKSSKTIRDQLSVFRMVFHYALVNQYISSDPTLYITPPKGIPKIPREALTESEVETVRNSINCTFGFFAYFILMTGLRRGEALALTYDDIDFKNKTVSVSKSVYHQSNRPCIKEPKTAAGNRTAILPDCLLNIFPKRNKGQKYLFTKDGGLMRSDQYQKLWKKYQEETGLHNVTAHMLRHTYTTMLHEAGVDVKDAQILLGHSDVNVTQNIYTHVRESRYALLSNQIDKYFNDEIVKG